MVTREVAVSRFGEGSVVRHKGKGLHSKRVTHLVTTAIHCFGTQRMVFFEVLSDIVHSLHNKANE